MHAVAQLVARQLVACNLTIRAVTSEAGRAWTRCALELAAVEHHTTCAQANCIRCRAERRLRPVLALAS